RRRRDLSLRLERLHPPARLVDRLDQLAAALGRDVADGEHACRRSCLSEAPVVLAQVVDEIGRRPHVYRPFAASVRLARICQREHSRPVEVVRLVAAIRLGETDRGYETYDLDGPAVLSLAYAREADGSGEGPINVWTAADLVDDLREHDRRFGQTGSPTRVLAVRDVTPERSGELVESVDEASGRVESLQSERQVPPPS